MAGVLAVGPLPLAAGLRCAGEIAGELRDLHERSRAYGKLTASRILMTGSGAHLLPLPDYQDGAMRQRDVEAFGDPAGKRREREAYIQQNLFFLVDIWQPGRRAFPGFGGALFAGPYHAFS